DFVDFCVDPDAVDGVEPELPDTAPVFEVAAPVDDESEDGPVEARCPDEPEGDGSADASHGVAPSAAPMPSATANAPTRPMYLEYPIIVPFPRPRPCSTERC